VEGQVARRDPGNPQRTIETFVEGHEDEARARRSDLIKELITRAEITGGRLEYRYIVKRMKTPGLPGFRLVVLAKSMAEDLKKLGVKVYF